MFTVTCVVYVLSQVTITIFNRAIPVFAISQSVAMSIVLIFCNIKPSYMAEVLSSLG